MKRKKILMMFAVLAVSLAATSLILNVVKRQEIENGISSKVVRFHVRAQSNSDEDQEIKLKVRDDVLQTAEMLLSGCKTREECIEILEKNTELIEKTIIEHKEKRTTVDLIKTPRN